jgi:type I restriction enzyme S subunit
MNNITKAKEEIGFKQTEVGLIPEDWEVLKLGELAFVTKLAGFEYSLHFNSYKDEGEVIVLRGTNITNNKLDFSDVKTIPIETSNKLIRSKLFKNDLVFAYVGTIGPICLIEEDNRYHLGPNTAKISVNSKVNSKYLLHYFTSTFISNEIFETTSVGAQPSLSMSKIRTFNITVPSLAEQKAIATALSDVDEFINSLEQLIAKKKAIKQGAMQELLGFDSAQPTTPRKRLSGFSGDWEQRRLGELCKIKSGESPSKFIFEDGDVPFFKVEQLNYGIKFAEFTPYYIKHHEPIKPGSIVFPKRGASIFLNKVRIFKHESFLDTNLMSLIVTKELNNVFLFYVLTYQRLDMIADTTSIPQINNKHIILYLIYMPVSLDEQRAIVEILSAMDLEIDSLETKKEKYKNIKDGMMQELLTGKIRLV